MPIWIDALFRPAEGGDLNTALIGQYDPWLVVLSFCVASIAALGALMTAQRLPVASAFVRGSWLAAGSVSMGGGVWAMHFIGMLAFTLPCGVDYSIGLTILSVLPSILASAIALHVLGRPDGVSGLSKLLCAVLMGGGIGTMHYMGMAAMDLDAILRYDVRLVALSVLVAVVLAYISLSIRGLSARDVDDRLQFVRLALAALVMGGAVSGMHYTAMHAAVFFPLAEPSQQAMTLPPTTLAILVVIFALSLAMTTMATAFAGRQVETARALRQEMRRRAAVERESAQGKARLEAIFNTVADGIITIDAKGIIQHWSPSAARMFGYEYDELLGRNVSELMPEPDRTGHDGYLHQFLNTGKAKVIGSRREVLGRRKSGELFPLDLLVGQVKLGTEVLFTGIVRDVTEAKHVQEKLEAAVRDADAANRAKSAFVANVSHEIRTPLNAITGMAHILMRGGLPPTQQDQVRKILKAGRSLLSIINDILDFSKIEAQQVTIESVPFELERVLQNVVDMVVEPATSKGLELVLDVDPELPVRLIGDPLRLGQVLLNYLNNAIKFTESGEVKLSVRAEMSRDERILLRFTVKDTGIGVAPDAQERLFQPFQQAESSTSRRFGGTGLGLVICRRLAELMGGEAGLSSDPGQGSSFWFTAWLGVASNAIDRRQALAPDLRGRRALVVEDNESTRLAISAMLRSMTFTVEDATDGSAALARMRAALDRHQGYDIVFVDWRMPGLDGLETIDAIRKMCAGQVTPAFVLVTAYGGEEVLHRATRAGIGEILVKPVNASALLDSASRALGVVSEEAPRPATSGEEADNTHLAGLRILVAEDNDLNQDVALELLSRVGILADVVSNGASAVDRVRRHRYDLVLMDMQMPEMDGLDATRLIRETLSQTELPIIAMTANAMASDRKACLDSGMNDHLSKPVDPDALYHMLARWTGRSAAAAPERRKYHLQDDIPEPFDRLGPDFDVHSALHRVLGKTEMYASMLKRFHADQGHTPELIRQALAAGDLARAEILAHSIKGLAAQIGANVLSGLAAQVEAALRAGGDDPALPVLLADFAEGHASVHAAIERIVSEPPPVQAAEPDPALMVDGNVALEQLIALLRDDDPAAAELAESQRAALRAVLGAGRHDDLCRAMDKFDFDIALAVVVNAPRIAQAADSASNM